MFYYCEKRAERERKVSITGLLLDAETWNEDGYSQGLFWNLWASKSCFFLLYYFDFCSFGVDLQLGPN